MNRAIFLDRDGTLNRDFGYVHDWAHWQWLPGVVEALAALQKAGWLLLVASNQSGIARHYFDMEDLQKLQACIDADLQAKGIRIDKWYYCPHGPGDDCQCRKPRPGLLWRAAREFNVDMRTSWMIGDRLRDVQTGLACGTHAGLLHNAAYEDEWQKCRACLPQVKLWPDLASAANFILSQSEI